MLNWRISEMQHWQQTAIQTSHVQHVSKSSLPKHILRCLFWSSKSIGCRKSITRAQFLQLQASSTAMATPCSALACHSHSLGWACSRESKCSVAWIIPTQTHRPSLPCWDVSPDKPWCSFKSTSPLKNSKTTSEQYYVAGWSRDYPPRRLTTTQQHF